MVSRRRGRGHEASGLPVARLGSGLGGEVSTIDDERSAGDVARFVARQEQCRISDFDRLPGSFEQTAVDQRGLYNWPLVLVHRGYDITRVQRVAADAIRPVRGRDILADIQDCALGRLIGVGVRHAGETPDRSQIMIEPCLRLIICGSASRMPKKMLFRSMSRTLSHMASVVSRIGS